MSLRRDTATRRILGSRSGDLRDALPGAAIDSPHPALRPHSKIKLSAGSLVIDLLGLTIEVACDLARGRMWSK